MSKKTLSVAILTFVAGLALGWIVKPTHQAAPKETKNGERHARKARIAESKTRIKTVTAIVTNTIHNVVTNMVVREMQRRPENFFSEMERIKNEDPERYAEMTNHMATFRARMMQRTENRLETLSSIDTTGWSKTQIATHERYQELIARREELMDMLRPDNGATEDQRRDAMEQLRELQHEIRRTGRDERNILLGKTLSSLGYSGTAAAEIKEAITTIYSTTQDWGGPPHGRRRGDNPPPPPPAN